MNKSTQAGQPEQCTLMCMCVCVCVCVCASVCIRERHLPNLAVNTGRAARAMHAFRAFDGLFPELSPYCLPRHLFNCFFWLFFSKFDFVLNLFFCFQNFCRVAFHGTCLIVFSDYFFCSSIFYLICFSVSRTFAVLSFTAPVQVKMIFSRMYTSFFTQFVLAVSRIFAAFRSACAVRPCM